MEEEDRISLLPDCLLVDILSRLYYTEEAIRTSILSKRWEHLWTLLPNLIFTHDVPDMEKRSIGDFLLLVDKTLTHCGNKSDLDEFQLNTCYVKKFQSQVHDCIKYAVSRNVQDLTLIIWSTDHVDDDFELCGEFIFTNSCLTSLTLSGLRILPVGTISWHKLMRLCIAQAKLDEDLMQNILSGSPFLEYLDLRHCYGIRRIDITTKSIKKFVFSGYYPRDDDFSEFDAINIEINAPYILSLTIKHIFTSEPVLLNVSSLVKAKLDYEKHYLKTMQKGADQELLKVFILRLSHAKEVKIGESCSKVFRRLKRGGFTFPSNMKIIDFAAPSESDLDELGDPEEVLLDDGSESEGYFGFMFI